MHQNWDGNDKTKNKELFIERKYVKFGGTIHLPQVIMSIGLETESPPIL